MVINLPETGNERVHAPHGNAEKRLYPDVTSWTSINSEAQYQRLYPYMPARLIDNLLEPKAKVSVTSWRELMRLCAFN